MTTLVPSDADTKKKGSLRLAAKLKLFDVTYPGGSEIGVIGRVRGGEGGIIKDRGEPGAF